MPQITSWDIGVGVSCFVGAVGGMYLAYRGVNHLRKVKEHSQHKNELCPICNTKIDSVIDTNWISCVNCAQIVCRKPKCSKWIASRGQSEWECQLCHDQRRAHFKASEWLLLQLSKKLQISNALDLDDISLIDYDNQLVELNASDVNGAISASQKEYIRAFLEDLLSTLLGGPLDNVLVGPIRKSSDYLPVCDHECPGLAQANLKRLIQKIIAEASRLPELLNRSGVPPRPEEHLPYFDPKKYNQLLATAVLNKVVESYHNPLNQVLTKDEFLRANNVDINQNTVKPEKDIRNENEIATKESEIPKTSAMKIETQSELLSPAAVSSVTSQSVYSDDDSESSEQLLETLIKQQKIKNKLPDLTSDDTNDDEYNSIKSVATDSTWEDNWMFKSKKNTNDGSNSIAMLIPSPTEDVKVLIGDRTADEISDLSDNHDSDNDDEYSNSSDSLSDSDEPPQSPADIPNVLVQNKTVIGGKHPLTDFIENASDFESMTSQNSFSEAKNDMLIEDGDFVKVDKPLLDIEYSTLDMKNGNFEKMKEAINPYVERKVDSEDGLIQKDSGSVKVAKNIVLAESQKTKEIVVEETPVPAPRKSSKGDLPTPINASPKPEEDDAFENIDHIKIKIHPTAIHKRIANVANSPEQDYSIDLLPIIDIGTQHDDHETILHAIYISSPPPLQIQATPPPHHDVIATKIINISDHDDNDGDDGDVEDDDDDDDDDVGVDDSDFDLISVNSSEFSFYKPRNMNAPEEIGVTSPIDKIKTSFEISNEEICKEILEMVAKQPQDIAVSTIPTFREETKITITQTVWQPRVTTQVNKATWTSENTSSTVDDEDLVGASLDADESIDESSKSLRSIVGAAPSPVESEDNFESLQSVNESLKEEQSPSRKNQIVTIEESPTIHYQGTLETTELQDQLSKQVEPLVDDVSVHIMSEYVVVKEYVPEETTAKDNIQTVNSISEYVELKEYIPTNEEIIKENIPVIESEFVIVPETTDLKDISVPISKIIQKFENISLTENNVQTKKQTDTLLEPTVVEITTSDPVPVDTVKEGKKVKSVTFSVENKVLTEETQIPTIEITPNTPVPISIPETVYKLEQRLNNLKNSDSDKPVSKIVSETLLIPQVKIGEVNISKSQKVIPEHEVDIVPVEPHSVDAVPNVTVLVKTEQEKEIVIEKINSEPQIPTDIKFHIQAMDLAKIELNEPFSIIVTEEVRKIEEKLEDVNNETQRQNQSTVLTEIDNEPVNKHISVIVTEDSRQFETKTEEVKVLAQEITVTVQTSQILEQKFEECEPQLQTTDVKETVIEPVYNIVTEEIRKIGERLEVIQEISANDLKEDEKYKSNEVKAEKLNRLEEPTIQTTDVKEIEVNEPVSINATDEVRIIKEELEIVNIKKPDDLPVEIKLQIQTTDLKVDEEVKPTELHSVVISEETKQMETRIECVRILTQETTVEVNTSHIVAQKWEEYIVEPQIQTTEANVIETVLGIVTEEMLKTEEKLEDETELNVLPIVDGSVQNETILSQEIIVTTKTSQIPDENSEEFGFEQVVRAIEMKEQPLITTITEEEPKIQTTDVKRFDDAIVDVTVNVIQPQIQTNEPLLVIVPEKLREIEENLEVVKNLNSTSEFPVEEEPKIQTTDVKENKIVIADVIQLQVLTNTEQALQTKESVLVIVPENVQKIEDKLEVVKNVNSTSLSVEEEPKIQTADVIVKVIQTNLETIIQTNEPLSVIVPEEVRKIEEKLEVVQNENTFTLSVEVEAEIQTTDVKEYKDASTKVVTEVMQPQIQINKETIIQTNEPLSVIVPKEVRKIEEKLEVVQNENTSTLSVEEKAKIQTTDVKDTSTEIMQPQIQTNIETIIQTNEPLSVIVPKEVRKIEEKLEVVQIENTSTLSVEVEPKIQTTDVKEYKDTSTEVMQPQIQINKETIIQTNEALSVIVPKEVRKIEEKLEVVQIENTSTLSVEVEPKIQTTDVKEYKDTSTEVMQPQIQINKETIIQTNEPLSVIVPKEVRKIEEKLEVVQIENTSTLSVEVEPKIQTTDVKEYKDTSTEVMQSQIQINKETIIQTNEPLPVIVPKEVRKIKEKLEVVQIENTSTLSVEVEPKIQTTDREFRVPAEIRKIEDKLEMVQNENSSSLPTEAEPKIQTTEVKENEEDLTEVVIQVIQPQIQTNEEHVIQNNEPLSIIVPVEIRKIEKKLEVIEIQPTDEQISDIVTEELREIDEKLDVLQNINSSPSSVEVEQLLKITDIINTTKVNAKDRLDELLTIVVKESEQIETNEEEVVSQEIKVTLNSIPNVDQKLEQSVTKLVEKLEEIQKENTELEEQIKTTDLKQDEQANQAPANKNEKLVTKVDEVKTEKSIIEPQVLTKESVIEQELPKLKVKLETVSQIKLAEFQDFPISKLPNQSTTFHSHEPLQLTITSEIDTKPVSAPIDDGYEIITESEIKSIPIEIESSMKSSKLVAGLTTKKVSSVTLTLEPITTVVIEKQSTPPKSEAVEDYSRSLAPNLQAIEHKAPEPRYSSPIFTSLLPTSPPPPVVKLTIVDGPTTTTTNHTNTSTSNVIMDTTTITTTTTTTTSITKTNEEDEVILVAAPFRGSIAEREHQKWQNAAPMANNPYSVEVLERRLSQKVHDTSVFKISEPAHPVENGKPVTQDKLLVDVFKAEVPSLKRFGRDYYINEAKKASGERLRRSELLNRQQHNDSTSSDDHVNDNEYQKFLFVRAATEQFVENERDSNDFSLQKSKSSGDTNRVISENIFAARPIMVEEDDPILERAQRLDMLSTDDRDFFLLPIEEAQMSIGFTSSEASSLRSPSSLSEDSDTARVYNLRSQEIKIVKETEPKYISPALIPKIIPKSPTVLKTAPSFVQVTTPPPAKLSVTTRIMSKSVPTIDTTEEYGQTIKRDVTDDINSNIAIEEEIKHILPSVRNLAKAFTETNDKPAPGPINKPKTPWHSTNNLSKTNDSDVASPKPQPVKIAEPFIRPGYSISGRSISKQVKDELREITPKSNASNTNKTVKVVAPPRSPSPTPVPGALRNTLAFFENLNHKH